MRGFPKRTGSDCSGIFQVDCCSPATPTNSTTGSLVRGGNDLAMRAWAVFDSLTAEAVRRVDETRLGYVNDLFLRMGFELEEAKVRSRMSYYYTIGEAAAGIDLTPEDRLAFLDLRYRKLVDRTTIQ